MTRTRKTDRDWDALFHAISREDDVAAYRASLNLIADGTAQPDPFRVLLATIISLRTRDEVTLPASERLFQVADTPRLVADMPEERIAELIYPAGFYRTKAGTIRSIARIIRDEHDCVVPATRETLTALPGVGPKTANLVLGLGFGIPAICVDTHVHRVANRMGWVQTGTPEKTEGALERVLPRRYWIPVNPWLVAFGRIICTPGRPFCGRCPVYESCDRVGVTRSR